MSSSPLRPLKASPATPLLAGQPPINQYTESTEALVERLNTLVQNMVAQGQRALQVESATPNKKEQVDFQEMRSKIHQADVAINHLYSKIGLLRTMLSPPPTRRGSATGLGSVLNILKPIQTVTQTSPEAVQDLKELLERYEAIDRVPRWIDDPKERKSPGIVARRFEIKSQSTSPTKSLMSHLVSDCD